MSVIVLGDYDAFVEHDLVAQAVEERNGSVIEIDVADWPDDGPVQYRPTTDDWVFRETIPTDDVTGVFSMIQTVFEPLAPNQAERYDSDDDLAAYKTLREWKGLFQSFIASLQERGATVTVSPVETYWNRVRPWMLRTYDQNGIPVPDTVFTNDPALVREFVNEHGETVVQLVNGGGTPELLTPSDLDEQRLEKLSAAPIKLQEYVPGEDVRGYVVDGEFAGMFAYEHDSDSMSFKNDEPESGPLDATPVSGSPALRETVVQAGRLTPSRLSAVDVRRKSDGEFTVLESNTPGRFALSDMNGVTDVSGNIAASLME